MSVSIWTSSSVSTVSCEKYSEHVSEALFLLHHPVTPGTQPHCFINLKL